MVSSFFSSPEQSIFKVEPKKIITKCEDNVDLSKLKCVELEEEDIKIYYDMLEYDPEERNEWISNLLQMDVYGEAYIIAAEDNDDLETFLDSKEEYLPPTLDSRLVQINNNKL